jgi:hypothetical protein
MMSNSIPHLVALLLALSGTSAIGAATNAPSQLRCEYLENPLGIDVLKPRLSWKLEASPEARGLRQTAYQVLVASTPGMDKPTPTTYNPKQPSKTNPHTGSKCRVRS